MYKLELHAHTAGVSLCSDCEPEQEVELYKQAGYHGIVLTNHINNGAFRDMEDASWDAKIDHFMSDYHKMKKAAGNDLDILLGCEVNLTTIALNYQTYYIPNDYLVYGVTEDWLRKNGDVRRDTLEVLSAKVHEAGFVFVHAHPFRYNTRMMNETLFDGMEVYNACNKHPRMNALADCWAQINSLIRTSGSDFHHAYNVIGGGIETDERIRDNETLLRVLRSGNYSLIRPGQATAENYLKK